MKVLVISRNAWDDTNSIGNTLTNFFQNLDGIEVANIYFRGASPKNKVCKEYYRVSETEVLKNWLTPDKIGRHFFQEQKDTSVPVESKEKKLIRVIHRFGLRFAYKLSDTLWYSEKWINGNLKQFVETFSPDLVFSFVKSAPQYYLTIKYLRENFDIPLLTWIADDEYTGLHKRNAYREIQNLSYILAESTEVRGCSEEICEYYNSIFGCQATPLYKSCDLVTPVKDVVGNPIKIVYAGNLLYGRLEIIREISKAIEAYTSERKKEVAFEIYSNTLLSESEKASFEQLHGTVYMGQRDYETIKVQLAKADIVLHAESFDEEQILKTKYSFSTKIIDCLQSGSVLLGIGPKEISSIKYIGRIPGACVIDDLQMLHEHLFDLLDHAESFSQRAKCIREFACKNHDAVIWAEEFKNTITGIIKGRL